MILLVFFLCCYSTQAQVIVDETQYTDETESEVADSTLRIQPDTTFYFSGIELSKNHVDSLKKLKSYSYISTLEKYLRTQKHASGDKNEEDRSGTVERTKSAKRNSWFSKMTGKWEFNFMLWMLATFFILVAAYFFFVRNRLFIKETRLQQVIVDAEQEEGGIHNYETAYLSAKSKNDYRAALKFLFLHSLYLLSEKGKLAFSPDKTNQDYLLELPINFQKDFAVISLAYEYIWYGRQPLNPETFAQKEKIFLHFIDRIQAA